VNLRPRPEVVITANEIRLDAPNKEPIWPICPVGNAQISFVYQNYSAVKRAKSASCKNFTSQFYDRHVLKALTSVCKMPPPTLQIGVRAPVQLFSFTHNEMRKSTLRNRQPERERERERVASLGGFCSCSCQIPAARCFPFLLAGAEKGQKSEVFRRRSSGAAVAPPGTLAV
jgi:hypothetical protein